MKAELGGPLWPNKVKVGWRFFGLTRPLWPIEKQTEGWNFKNLRPVMVKAEIERAGLAVESNGVGRCLQLSSPSLLLWLYIRKLPHLVIVPR